MKFNKRKIFLSVFGILLSLIFIKNTTVYAYNKPTNVLEDELKFTEETQSKINLVQNMTKKGGIKVNNGFYFILNKSESISRLDSKTKSELNDFVSFFNEGISLGIFEINNENCIVSSKNYEKDNHNIIPSIAQISIDSMLKDNGNTMIRTSYINVSSYGPNIGAVETGKFFASKVKTGGPWDYKRSFGTNTVYSAYVNGRYERMTGEDIGNANYGYAGRKAFGATLLRSAAGAYQIYSGTSYVGWYKSYFDDPNDQYWINRGISYSEGKGF